MDDDTGTRAVEEYVDSNDDNYAEEVDDIGDEKNDGNKGKRKREKKHTSPVWTVFELLPTKKSEDTSTRKAKCKWCGDIKNYCGRTGTGNLKRHLETCVRRDSRDVGQMLFGKDKDSLVMKSKKVDPTVFREKFVAAIIMHNIPLSFVDYVGIRDLFEYVCGDLTLISRNTARADILKMHQREKVKLKLLLRESPGRICLTSNLWTSINTDGFISLTAHFIDKNWVLQKRLLNFSIMPPPHNGIALSEKIYSLLTDWKIDTKLFSITLDNASSNDTFVDFLKLQLNVRQVLIQEGRFFHIRCCAHILNLIVQDGLKVVDVGVKKVRESVKYIKGSQIRKQKFLECVRLVSLDSKRGLKQDVSTRWNSTYLMLRSALYYRMAFNHWKASDSNYTLCPTKEEWHRIEVLSLFLSVLYDITCVFSGSKYPTSSLYFPSILMARMTLEKHRQGKDEKLKIMANLMFQKFEKYWSEFSLILAIAVVFDPRYKLQTVEWGYGKIYGEASQEFKGVKDTLLSLYDLYCSNSLMRKDDYSTSKDLNEANENSSGNASGLHANEAWKEFESFDHEYDCSTKKSELEQYLAEPRMPRTAEIDILEYWKGHQIRYPDLTAMARDILSIPVTTVASESAFSVGGKVLNEYRSSLTADIAEALICTKDWMFGDADNNKDDQVNEHVDLECNNEESSSTSSTVFN